MNTNPVTDCDAAMAPKAWRGRLPPARELRHEAWRDRLEGTGLEGQGVLGQVAVGQGISVSGRTIVLQ